jgi:hypothetical protein
VSGTPEERLTIVERVYAVVNKRLALIDQRLALLSARTEDLTVAVAGIATDVRRIDVTTDSIERMFREVVRHLGLGGTT